MHSHYKNLVQILAPSSVGVLLYVKDIIYQGVYNPLLLLFLLSTFLSLF